jgi:general secretion pathway protein A
LYQKGIVENQTVTLIIDEAHKLTASSLEALRILLNYETNETKLFQLILLGQMELLPVIQSMPNLNDRISMKCVLKPLDVQETREMIEFRLREAGYCSRSPLFSEDAVQEIHQYTQGYPRRISLLCHRALRYIVMRDEPMVTSAVVREVIQPEMEAGWTPAKTLQKSASFV